MLIRILLVKVNVWRACRFAEARVAPIPGRANVLTPRKASATTASRAKIIAISAAAAAPIVF